MQLASHVTNPIFYVDIGGRDLHIAVDSVGRIISYDVNSNEIESSEETPSTPEAVLNVTHEIFTYLQSLSWLDTSPLEEIDDTMSFDEDALAVAALPPHHLTDHDDIPQSCAALVPYDDTRYFAFNFDQNDGVGAILQDEAQSDRIRLFDSHGIRVGAIAMSSEVMATCQASLAQNGGVLRNYTIAGQLSIDQALLWWYV